MLRFNTKCALSLLLWVATAGAQTATTVTYSYDGYPLYIPIDSANVIAVTSIVVPDTLKVTKVTAKVVIQYPYVGDLNVFLYSPDGTRAKLLERNCGGLQNVDTTFDDTAQSMYSDYCPVTAGLAPFRGNEPLSNFNSSDSSLGVWRLAVENNGSDSRSGWVKGFTLQITGTQQVSPTFRADTVLNSASGRSGVIAPGENITILGLGLGPAAGVTAPAGTWPTSLGGVSVSINGTDIPLAYASGFRIDGQVPYGMATTGPAAIQVRNTNTTTASALVSVSTQPTSPGVYTFDQSGFGAAKAINQDGKLNSVLTPARAGEVVTIYASGLGAVVPAIPAGQAGPTNPLSVVSQTVAASIGGVPAPVTFAGLAPGYAGIYQVNIMIPAGVPAGTRVIFVSNAGNTSQGLVTIEVQ
jgi:uncharacterized protein (TIGR03437 family)